MNFVLMAVHVLALMFWIGSLVSITRVISSGAGEPEAVRAKLASAARRVYRAVSSPWMGVAVLTGLAMVGWGMAHRANYFRHGWFHGKLTAAIVVLALHFVLGARVRAAEAQGLTDDAARGMRALQLGVLVSAALAVGCIVVWKGLRPLG